MIDWTEKYRPNSLKDIIGNQRTVASLRKWADDWSKNIPKKKAVILSGNPGVGKTSCAYAIANQFHWTPIELNTSDARNKQRIKSVATAGSQHQTFTDDGSYLTAQMGGRKLIILDEADNLYERISNSSKSESDLSDKGGKTTIVSTVKITKQPIILIVNDYYNLIKGSGGSLKSLCHHFIFYPPKPDQIINLLLKICRREEVRVDPSVLQKISNDSNGDIRSAVRDLQSLCIGKSVVRKEDASILGFRDRTQVIFDVLSLIFKSTDIDQIKQNIMQVNEDPNMLIHWIAENLPSSYRNLDDLVSGYEHLSKADLYLGRTFRRSNYRLWSYASDHMALGVSLSKTRNIFSHRYQYPAFLKLRKKLLTQEEQSITEKLGRFHHCSLKKTYQHMLPVYKMISKQDMKYLSMTFKDLSLGDEELVYFYGKKILDKKKKDDTNKKNDFDKNVEKAKETIKGNVKKSDEEKSSPQKQQTLFSSL